MIKSVVKKIPFAFTLSQKIHDLLRKDLLHKQLKIKRFGGGYCKLSKYVKGRENRMEIGHNCYLNGVKIRIVGNYNTIIFKNNCASGKTAASGWREIISQLKSAHQRPSRIRYISVLRRTIRP